MEAKMICNAILTPVVLIVRTLVQVARQIVRTVCEWVSSVITVVKEVLERVCEWLPWPLSELCSWVRRLVTVVETVWNWVCHDVLETIIDVIEVFFEYVIYVLKWVCWAIDWVIRLPGLLLCLLGIEPRKYMGVCVKLLADGRGNPAVSLADAQGMMRDAASLLRRCNIDLVVCSYEVVVKPEYLSSTVCTLSGMFQRFFSWFSSNTCGCCSTVTVYFVQDIKEAQGCSYPGTDWILVDAKGDGTVVVHEIGHLADLWSHTSDPDNIMTNTPGGTHDQITDFQCCMLRTSRFARFLLPCGLVAAGRDDAHEPHDHAAGAPFKRKERGGCGC
jgi:hypothetical protein